MKRFIQSKLLSLSLILEGQPIEFQAHFYKAGIRETWNSNFTSFTQRKTKSYN